MDFGRVRYRYFLLYNGLDQILMALTIAVSIYLASRFLMTDGEYSAFLGYMILMAESFVDILFLLGDFQESKVSCKRTYELLEMQNPMDEKFGEKSVSKGPHITFAHVSVVSKEQELLCDVTVDIPYGKKLGIMGKTGSGKSVFLKTMQGFNHVLCDMRKDLFSHLMKLGFDYYDSRPSGKILVRITSYTDAIASFFINDMVRAVYSFFVMVIAFFCICFIEIRLAVAVLIVSLPLAAAIGFLSKELGKRVNNDRNKYSNRTAFVSESIAGLEVIKSFNREDLNETIHEELNRKHQEAFMQTTHVREVFFPMTYGTVQIISTIVVYGTALFLIL